MMPIVDLLPGAVLEILASVANSHNLTKADQYGLMAAVMDESLPEEDRRCLDRLLRSLVRGKITVTDPASKSD